MTPLRAYDTYRDGWNPERRVSGELNCSGDGYSQEGWTVGLESVRGGEWTMCGPIRRVVASPIRLEGPETLSPLSLSSRVW